MIFFFIFFFTVTETEYGPSSIDKQAYKGRNMEDCYGQKEHPFMLEFSFRNLSPAEQFPLII